MTASHLQLSRLWFLSCCFSPTGASCGTRENVSTTGCNFRPFTLHQENGQDILWSYCSGLPSPLLLRPGTAFAEAAVTLGFVVVALIGTVCALDHIGVLWLLKLGSELKALGVDQRQGSIPRKCPHLRELNISCSFLSVLGSSVETMPPRRDTQGPNAEDPFRLDSWPVGTSGWLV